MKTLVETKSEFLSNYCPQEMGWTSQAEMERVADELGLEGLDKAQLFELRNEVVRFYTNLMKQNIIMKDGRETRSDKYYDICEAMMSVTAIVDEYKLKAGYSVNEI